MFRKFRGKFFIAEFFSIKMKNTNIAYQHNRHILLERKNSPKEIRNPLLSSFFSLFLSFTFEQIKNAIISGKSVLELISTPLKI
jgi:hypothetical protein